MGREAELIKEIDEHIEKAGGLYGLELPDSDLRIIRAALCRTVEADPVNKDIGFGDTALSCPACGKPIMNYYALGTRPACCQFCGQALKAREAIHPLRNKEGYKDPTAGAAIASVRWQEKRRKKEEKREQKTSESSHAGESEGAELK